jgi:hypothetical protein
MDKEPVPAGSFKAGWALLLALPLLAGCPHNDYVVELRPGPGGLERKLICSRQDKDTNGVVQYQDFPSNELAEIEGGYPKAPAESNKVLTFTGTFANRLPKDLDGWGEFVCRTSRLGSACFYLERFRGSTDLAGQMETRLGAMDELTDYLAGWLKHELGRQKNFRVLQERVNNDLRRDLKELSMRCSLKGDISEADLALAAVEGGYFTTPLPDDFKSPAAWAQLRACVQNSLGGDAAALKPGALDFLRDEDAANLSFSNYLATTTQYKRLLKEWKAEGAKASPPNALSLAEKALERGFEGAVLSPKENDRLIVRLYLPEKPDQCNGEWDDAAKRLTWEYPLPERGSDYHNPPAGAFAAWSVANEAQQQKCFGKVVLTGDELSKYCQWFAALSPARQAVWDGMLDRLSPGDQAALKSFRFRDEGSGPGGSVADYARGLLKAESQRTRAERK